MSAILTILVIWVVVIPAAYCLSARVVPALAARRARHAMAALNAFQGPRITGLRQQPTSVRRFARH